MKAIRLLLLALSALMISCSSAPAPSHEAAQDAPELSGFSRESRGSISSRDSGFSSSSRDSSSSRPSLPLIPITDDYDDGLLDGEALSEEDRLAGKPGMQVGLNYDEDEEDDYEDGYDDGYEE